MTNQPVAVNTILCGDALTVLKTFPDESIDCVMTSPPYWSLRDYKVDGQLGMEETFEEYIQKLSDIFSEVKRVLCNQGTCFINLGDSYASSGKQDNNFGKTSKLHKKVKDAAAIRRARLNTGYPDKCLCMIPERFAIEMISRGWILRNEIIWHKPNCMPCSVTDRFTVDFEKIFFFVKRKEYSFTQQIVPTTSKVIEKRMKKEIRQEYCGKNTKNNGVKRTMFRNMRCVLSVNTRPYNEAHFATYPEELIEPIIRSGCPENRVVLDPFFGAGTTGLVALKLNRTFIGIELNPEYVTLAQKRLRPYLTQTKLEATI